MPIRKKEIYSEEIKNLPYQTEQLKVSKNSVVARVNIFRGQEGEIWVAFIPSLDISGYGKTPEEAEKSLDHNVDLFCSDLNVLKPMIQRKVLRDLGWTALRYRQKQFARQFREEKENIDSLTNLKVKAWERAYS